MAFFLPIYSKQIFDDYLQMYDLPKRFTVITYISQQETPYPINKLRNIAISFVHTSHFWVADMDMWPSSRLYPSRITYSGALFHLDQSACLLFEGRQECVYRTLLGVHHGTKCTM